MSPSSPNERQPSAKFDAYAETYTALHDQSITASGESSEYFAHYKLSCLERLVGPGFTEPVLDYGCGVGALLEHLVRRFPSVEGYDPSTESLEQARLRAPSAVLHARPDDLPDGHFGLIVLANVLHHVPPTERPALVKSLLPKLEPERGRLVVFEHNPLNPLTRRAVAACAFDDDAILLWPRELTRLLRDNGYSASLRFIVFFPRLLARLRFAEPYLGWLPLGAQMMSVGRVR
jgi:SAM-dependent methyltransferase